MIIETKNNVPERIRETGRAKPGTETYQGGKYYGNDRTAQHDSDEH